MPARRSRGRPTSPATAPRFASFAPQTSPGFTATLREAQAAVDPADVEARAAALAEARSYLGERGIEAKLVEGLGNPADVIVQEAEDSGAELIVVGTRGLNAAKRLVLGSTSTNVVHHAPCDVLVVR